MNEQELVLATIGDLEINRRALIQEVQRLQARVEELEAQLAAHNGDLDLPFAPEGVETP